MRLTLPRNRLDQHLGDFVLTVCEKTIDQLSVNAEAKLNTCRRRRPCGVSLQPATLAMSNTRAPFTHPYGLCHSKKVSNRAVTFKTTKISSHVSHENGCRKAPSDSSVGGGPVRITYDEW